MTSLERTSPTAWIGAELASLKEQSLLRVSYEIEHRFGCEISLGGRKLLLAASNDYLGLSTDPRVREAAADAARRWGGGSSASPLVSGYSELQSQLESEIASFKGCDDCVVFSSGYLANIGTITALVGKGDVVFSDELNHASIIDGCRLSGAEIRIFRHSDPENLDTLAKKGGYRRGLIVTDGVFSMDGDLADLPAITEVAERYSLMTMVDDAHGTGVVGPTGRGTAEETGLEGQIDIVMGTLSKALGSAGGFVCGSSDIVSWIRNRARSFIFDTAPAPAALGAARVALRIAEEEEWRRERLRSMRDEITRSLSAEGIELPALAAAIVPLVIGDAERALRAADYLRELGVFAPAIRPPSVPEGTSRIRLSLMATFDNSHRELLVTAVTELARRYMTEPAAPVCGATGLKGTNTS